jgi:hypothetical protein
MVRRLRIPAMKQQRCAFGSDPMHEYLLHDLARATLQERRLSARDHQLLAAARRPRRGTSPRPGRAARLLAHLRLRPVDPPRRPEPAGAS